MTNLSSIFKILLVTIVSAAGICDANVSPSGLDQQDLQILNNYLTHNGITFDEFHYKDFLQAVIKNQGLNLGSNSDSDSETEYEDSDSYKSDNILNNIESLAALVDGTARCREKTITELVLVGNQLEHLKALKPNDIETVVVKLFISKALSLCKVYLRNEFGNIYLSYKSSPNDVDSLSPETLKEKIITSPSNPGIKMIEDQDWVYFIHKMTDHYLRKKRICKVTKASKEDGKYKIVPNLRVFSGAMSTVAEKCFDYQTKQFGLYSQLEGLIKQYLPELFNFELKVPKMFEKHADLYDDVKIRDLFCNLFFIKYTDQTDVRFNLFGMLIKHDLLKDSKRFKVNQEELKQYDISEQELKSGFSLKTLGGKLFGLITCRNV